MVKVSNTCDQTALTGVRFVDESAIEIDIADDDDVVCEANKKKVDCANSLSSLKHNGGVESVDSELTAQVGLQFETSVSDKVVENEMTLRRHHVTSQLCPQAETCPRLSLYGSQRNTTGDKGKLRKVLSDSVAAKAHFVDESAVEIDLADDDSSDSVVVIEDDSDNDVNSRSSTDISNLAEDTAGGRNDVVSDLQEDISSKQGSSDMTTSRRSSSNIVAASVNKMAPVVPHSRTVRRSQTMTTPTSNDEILLSEYNLQHLKTISSPDSAMVPEIVFDECDLQHLQKPFSYGWRRELVCRRMSWKNRDRMCDVYYMSPGGKRLRSRVEIATFMLSNTDSPVNLTHFTFKRVLLFNPPCEIVRLAGSRSLKQPVGQSNSPQKKTQLKDFSREENISTKQTSAEHSFTTKNVAATGQLDSLSSIHAESCVVKKNVAGKKNNPDKSSTPSLKVPKPSQLSELENATLQSKKPAHRLKKYVRKRMHDSSPE